MRFTHLFIDRPILATVLSVFLTLIGLGALVVLPVSQYPEIVPPTVQVTTSYPGASAQVVSQTVATPLEQQINGVEDMIYMSSQSTGDGNLTITVTFRVGTDLNVAQMLTQNRVQDALPRLPEDVQRLGVQVQKATPNILLAVHLFSPDGSRDNLYLSNYATLHVKDALARLPGVGNVQLFGARDYAMRIWLDPDKVAAYNLNAGEVLAALRAQNVQVSAGILNQPPISGDAAYQLNVQTLGRLSTPEQFADIILKTDARGRATRIRDVGRVEIGAADYGSTAYMDRSEGLPLLIFALPGANSLKVEHEVLDTIQDLKKDFPPGVESIVIYDPTIFVAKSVREVVTTIFVAILLVVGVVFLFLQTWRASLIPVIAIPVSLIGTFTILLICGISLNNLSLFGLVLAVGIVVDDAIVVVENVERNIAAGMKPKEAAHRTMDEVGGALVSIALTLCAVFVPSAFLSGISGQFFRQFAVTIAASTVISLIVSLTLSPALCALLLHEHDPHQATRGTLAGRAIRAALGYFNRGFEKLSDAYGSLTKRLVRGLAVVVAVYVALIAVAGVEFARTPTGFIPEQDQGYLITVLQLPPGSSLGRTEQVVKQATDIMLKTPGVEHVAPFAGLDATTFTVASNSGTIFSGLPSLYNHSIPGITANSVLADLRKRLSVIQGAYVLTIPPPPVQGIGNSGGFKMMLEDRAGLGTQALVNATNALVAAANKDPSFAGVFTLLNAGSPSVYADIDRLKAEKVGLTPTDVFDTLQVYLGSQYVNDFNFLGRTVRGDRPGRQPVPARPAGPDGPEGAQRQRRDGADRNGCPPAGYDDPVSRAALQSVSGGRGAGRGGAGRGDRHGAAAHGNAGGAGAAAGHRLRMDRDRLSAGAKGHADNAGVRCRRALCLPGAGGELRELEAAALGGADRADVSARLRHRAGVTRHVHRHPRADRFRGPGWAGGEECDPDRRVRAPGAGSGQHPRRGGGHCRASTAAADPDDVARLHPRRRAAGGRDRRRGRDAPIPGHRRLRRHARRHRLRPDLHAGVLHADAADRHRP